MGSMVIRNIPDDVLKRFKDRAKADGKSAEQLAREAITEKAKISREEAWARIDAIRATIAPVDIETAREVWAEHIRERNSRPYDPLLDDDR